jgi:phosphate starvation-inducible PhoH-like protein
MLDSKSDRVRVPSVGLMVDLLGEQDRHLRAVEAAFPAATIVARGTEVLFSGAPDAALAALTVVQELLVMVQQGATLESDAVERVIEMVNDHEPSPSGILGESVPVGRGKVVRPKTKGQRAYIDAIRDNTLVFSVGPAGTGKTYLAMAAAVEALTTGAVRRILLTRPAVEAGERLGFLPGDLEAKINPYLRPLYDALFDMLGPEEVARAMQRGDIEIAPLAYMRGRTLNDAIVILDEAQNTSRAQMKMFLTRLGFNSTMIITGDVTQVDLPEDKVSGLTDAVRVLRNVPDIAVVHLTSADVVRHRIVEAVIEAYEKSEDKRKRR